MHKNIAILILMLAGLSLLGHAQVANGSPIVAQINTIASTDEVFYVGTDLHIHELWAASGVWHAADVTAAAAAPNATAGSAIAAHINTIASTDEVFYLGTDLHIHELWEASGIWHAADVTAAAAAPNAAAGSAITVHINSIASTDEVFYFGRDLHVHELWESGGIWHPADVTAAAGAPNAISGSPITTQINTIASTDEVFYLGADQHVQELWAASGVWHSSDPTAAGGGPDAVSGSPLATQINTIASTDEAFFLGPDQDVHELWAASGVWTAADPTATAGAPNAGFGSRIAIHINTIASTDEVFYFGTDLHVHELWAASGVWHAADPTAAAGAPNAVSGSSIAVQINTIASTDEVFYVGSDQHVHELWAASGVWHSNDVSAAAGQ